MNANDTLGRKPLFPNGVRYFLIAGWDSLAWVAGALIATTLRYSFPLRPENWEGIWKFVVIAICTHLLVGGASRLHRGRFRVGSFEEFLNLTIITFVSSIATAIVCLTFIDPTYFPRAITAVAPPISLLIMMIGRGVARLITQLNRSENVERERALVFGAGEAGYQLVQLVEMDRDARWKIVGVIDDDPKKSKSRLRNASVLGSRAQLVEIARRTEATTVIVAIAGATAQLLNEINETCREAGLRVFVLPPFTDIVSAEVNLRDVRELQITDLLGRRQVDTNLGQISGYLRGKQVLITGAGGSIGSEIARQVHTFGPSELILLDHDESVLHGVQLDIYGQGLLNTPDMVLCSIRDEAALRTVFETHRPQVVFHAAALKHLPMLEQYPCEGWKTNVEGTLNLLRLAEEFGVECFVNVSTDKAADPTSVLGRTKQLAERLTAWNARNCNGKYTSVRFGNVLGSRGSVLHTFRKQIADGGPVTITDPEIERYFMTIPEACQLVIQSGAIGSTGETMVLDMGVPVKIIDVAKRLIEESGKTGIQIEFTGLRPGEKLTEVLFSSLEDGGRPHHPLISHVRVDPVDPAKLGELYEETTSSPLDARITTGGTASHGGESYVG